MRKIYEKLSGCRISGSPNLTTVLSLGDQALTGVFPKTKDEDVEAGPLELVWSEDSGLLQLGHSYNPSKMYGENYGYRSGLNNSMVQHLQAKIQQLESFASLQPGELVVDIGSNDCTTLKAYKTPRLKRVGIDPTISKFGEFYPADVFQVADFFSQTSFNQLGLQKAKIITSIAMFYDLESPVKFATDIHDILDENGVWHFEQSYLPSMLRANSYDTICHEHLEYYSLSAVKHILKEAGLRICDVAMNDINGGSFAVTACRADSTRYSAENAIVNWIIEREVAQGINDIQTYFEFAKRAHRHRDDLVTLVNSINNSGKKILGYGASTKGNVVLQFCGFKEKDIPAIAEVNEDKFGCFTPGTKIPICSEEQAHAMKPDYYLMLPWHFRNGILQREREFLRDGGRFVIPFPNVEIVS